jgi:hypothetical protein
MADKKEQYSSQKINFHSIATQSSHRARTECIILCVNIQSSMREKTVLIYIVLIIFNTNSSHHHICYHIKSNGETLECQIYGNHWTCHITLCQKNVVFIFNASIQFTAFCCFRFDMKVVCCLYTATEVTFVIN